jgi:hypothetical protein
MLKFETEGASTFKELRELIEVGGGELVQVLAGPDGELNYYSC